MNDRTEINHAYILQSTGEILGFDMKTATEKMGIGGTAFRTNLKNRYVCKVNVNELLSKLKVYQDSECSKLINSINYDNSGKPTKQ